MVLREDELEEVRDVNNWFSQWVSQVPVERLNLGQVEEYGDDEVPVCDECREACEWVYFSRNQGRVGELIVCGKCVERVQHGAGTRQWKQFVRSGLEEHMSACKELSNLAEQILRAAHEPRPAPAQAPPRHGHDVALVPVTPPAQVHPQHPLQLALVPVTPPAQVPPQHPLQLAPVPVAPPAQALAVPPSQAGPLTAQPQLVLQPGRGPSRNDKSEWRRYNAMEVRRRRWAHQLIPIICGNFDLGPQYKCNTLVIMRCYEEHHRSDDDPIPLTVLYSLLPRLGFEIEQESRFLSSRPYREVSGLKPKIDKGLS